MFNCITMNIIVWLGILTGFFLTIWANDFLSKFHQTDYKIKDLFVQNTYVNKKYIQKFELKTFKYNRSVTAINATIMTKKDTENKVEILVQAYKRTSNAYRTFPVRFQVNFCKMFNKNVIGFNNVLKHGNLTSCQVKKGIVYHIYNFVVDDANLPPFIPTGEYQIESTALYMDEPVTVTLISGQVYHPIPEF